jgi:hypothetical protein
MAKIEMTPVESSNVAEVGHDGKDLHVKFRNGSAYRYLDVPRVVFEHLLTAESIGKFLNRAIKPKYAFEKVAA